MESVSTFFKEENDILYILGSQRKAKLFVRHLLTQTELSTEKIAEIVEVPVSLVETVKASLNNGNNLAKS